MKDCCQTCTFFREEGSNSACVRFPPTVVPMRNDQGKPVPASVFPPTSPHLWCGEYRPALVVISNVVGPSKAS
jgi:hypothetical protein